MGKFKLKLSYNQYQALLLILASINFDAIDDVRIRLMVRFILERVYSKVVRKMAGMRFKEATLSLHPGEAAALYDAIYEGKLPPMGDYENSVLYEITNTIEPRLI